jgi:hypothetical protein
LHSDDHYSFFKSLFETEDSLKEFIMNLSHAGLAKLSDSVIGMTQNLSAVFKMGLRVKRIFDSAPDITGS